MTVRLNSRALKAFFSPSKSHSFQRLTIKWASRWQGILVYPGFYLIWLYVRGSLLTFPIDTPGWRRTADMWRGRAWWSRVTWTHHEETVRLSFSGQQMGPGPYAWLQDADLPGKGVVMGSLLLHHNSLLNNNYKQALGRNWFLKVFKFRVLVSRTFVFGQQKRMKENVSQTFFFLLFAPADVILNSDSVNLKLSVTVFIMRTSSVHWCNQSLRRVRSTTALTTPRSPNPRCAVSGCTGETTMQPHSSNFPSRCFLGCFFFLLTSFFPCFLLLLRGEMERESLFIKLLVFFYSFLSSCFSKFSFIS